MRYGCGLLVALICACGGGGGTIPANGNGNGTSPLQDAAQQVLEACAVSSVDDFLAVLEIFEGLLDPAETNPTPFVILGVDPGAASVDWTLDIDGDTNPDLAGSLSFTNDQGEPETAADVNLLAGGFDDLDTMLASLPDGTQLAIAAASFEPPPFDVVAIATVLGGAVDTVWGMANGQNLDCQTLLDFADASFQDLGGDYPTMTLHISATSGDGTVDGTIVFDGTNQARAEVTLGSDMEVRAFLINLDTGVVTPAP
jgi:hypothetical protein